MSKTSCLSALVLRPSSFFFFSNSRCSKGGKKTKKKVSRQKQIRHKNQSGVGQTRVPYVVRMAGDGFVVGDGAFYLQQQLVSQLGGLLDLRPVDGREKPSFKFAILNRQQPRSGMRGTHCFSPR